MSALVLSLRATSMREVDLSPYLHKIRDLIVDFEAAPRLGLRYEALRDMLIAGLGWEPRPTLVGGSFWFKKIHLDSFRYWVRKEATDDDLSAVADIIRTYDTHSDHRNLDNGDDRAFVHGVMGLMKPSVARHR